VVQRVSPLSAQVQALDAQRCVLEAGGNQLPMLVLHIAQLGFDFEVLEPPELVEHVRSLRERLARAEKASRPPRTVAAKGAAGAAGAASSRRSSQP